MTTTNPGRKIGTAAQTLELEAARLRRAEPTLTPEQARARVYRAHCHFIRFVAVIFRRFAAARSPAPRGPLRPPPSSPAATG